MAEYPNYPDSCPFKMLIQISVFVFKFNIIIKYIFVKIEVKKILTNTTNYK